MPEQCFRRIQIQIDMSGLVRVEPLEDALLKKWKIDQQFFLVLLLSKVFGVDDDCR